MFPSYWGNMKLSIIFFGSSPLRLSYKLSCNLTRLDGSEEIVTRIHDNLDFPTFWNKDISYSLGRSPVVTRRRLLSSERSELRYRVQGG